MTPTETAAILRQFNDWRRGDDETVEQPEPREIGEAIDAAVEMIERLDRLIQQDPVGWFARIDGDGPLMECKHADISRVRLYLAPGAQPAPSVPEGWKEVEFPRKVRAVAVGWETKCARLEQERDALRAKIDKLNVQSSALLKALLAIADWNSAWGTFPEKNEHWRAMAIVTAREATKAFEQGEQK